MSKKTPQVILEDDDFDENASIKSAEASEYDISEDETEHVIPTEKIKYVAEDITAKKLLEMNLENFQEVIVKYPFDPNLKKQQKPESKFIASIKTIPATRELPAYKQINFNGHNDILNMYCANCPSCEYYNAKFSVPDCKGCNVSGGKTRRRNKTKTRKTIRKKGTTKKHRSNKKRRTNKRNR
jgi:hypothetical protein